MSSTRLLYLGSARPPGITALIPGLQNGGHLIETYAIQSLRPFFDIRSVGTFDRSLDGLTPDPEASVGLAHELCLLDKAPELFTRKQSLKQLKAYYQDLLTKGWKPNLIVVFNLSPIYSAFLRWLHPQPDRPGIVQLMADAATLGQPISFSRRLRYRFKPMAWFPDQMISQFDACAAVSTETEKYFKQQNCPWFWYPGGLDPARAIKNPQFPDDPNIVFGYMGSLADYGSVPDMLRVFESLNLPNKFLIAGGGKNAAFVQERARHNPKIRYGGNLTPDGALEFAQECDVLVHPRVPSFGNQNNFPMKIFDYALSGRSMLSVRLSGVDRVLGHEAFYFDHTNFDQSLGDAFREVADVPRNEHQRRGLELQRRLLKKYDWAVLAPDLADFYLRHQRS